MRNGEWWVVAETGFILSHAMFAESPCWVDFSLQNRKLIVDVGRNLHLNCRIHVFSGVVTSLPSFTLCPAPLHFVLYSNEHPRLSSPLSRESRLFDTLR